MTTLAMHHRARLRPRRCIDPRLLNAAYARARAARLSPAAIRETMEPVRTCARYLCEGVASEDQFVMFRASMRIAQNIELHRALRAGIGGHIEAVLVALSAIHDRATATGAWHPGEINFNEQEAIKDMVDLHELQLQRITGGQLTDVVDQLRAETLASGGEFLVVGWRQVDQPAAHGGGA